ncbi:hypothetical protein FOZ62_019928, partial [Perkinsus olseni]
MPPQASVPTSTFSFLTWNVLHSAHYQRLLADPAFNNPKRRAIAPAARLVNLTNHLLRLNADIVALQELDIATLPSVKTTLQSQGGYRMVTAMINEAVQAKDGCALFCKADRFEPLATTEFRMCHALDRYLHPLAQCQGGLAGALYRETREKLNLCVAALLRDRLTGYDVLAATTHLFWSPKAPVSLPAPLRFPDIKLLQAYLLSRQLEDFAGEQSSSPAPAVVLGGDFNSTPPDSAVYQLLTKAAVDVDHPEHPVSLRPGNRIIPGVTEDAVGPLRLASGSFVSSAKTSLGKEPEFTNYTSTWQGCLDYVFYKGGRGKLRSLSLDPLPSVDILTKQGAQWWLTQYGNASFKRVRAVVPGQVHLDLWRSRLIPDPYYGYNDTALRYVTEADWLYSVEVAVPPGACDCRNVSLPATIVLQGLDTIAEVVVNGRLVVKADNMYRAYSAPMGRGQLLCDRRNKMSILLKSPVKAARERAEAYERQHAADWPKGVPPKGLPSAWNGFDKVQMIRKEPCSFGWDWGPGLATSGIWKDIGVITHERENGGPVIIEGITWETSSTNGDELDQSSYEPWMAYLYMNFSLPADTTIHRVNVELLLSDGSGATLYNGFWEKLRILDLLPGKSGINLLVTSGVKPWWPNGYGEQQRYTLAVCAWAGDSERACVPKRFTVGFRSVELVMEDD